MKGREVMTAWAAVATIVGTAWLLFTVFGVSYCAEDEDPFLFIRSVWDATEGKLNLAGRIICAMFTGIACIPIWILYFMGILVVFAVSCIVSAFWFIFKDRSKDKEKCNGNCVECPREYDYTFGDAPQIDFDSIHRDMFKD